MAGGVGVSMIGPADVRRYAMHAAPVSGYGFAPAVLARRLQQVFLDKTLGVFDHLCAARPTENQSTTNRRPNVKHTNDPATDH